MRFWPRSTTEVMRETFAFLIEAGYRLVSESGVGMGVTVTYRSPALWIAVNADRGDVWADVTPADGFDDPYDDRLLAGLLAGHDAFVGPDPSTYLRSIDECAAFVRANLAELERRFTPEHREDTRRRLAALAESSALRTKAWLAGKPRRAGDAQGQ